MFQKELLEKYLQEGNTEAAKQLISDYFSAEPTAQEQAEAYTLIAEIYLQSTNRINKQFLEDSAPALKALQELQKLESSVQDSSDMIDARKALE